MPNWTVKEGTQIVHDGKLVPAGKSFSATPEEIDAEGLRNYVEEVKRGRPPKAVQSSPNKAQASSANKAQRSSSNK